MKNTSVLVFDCACFGASVSVCANGTTQTQQLDQANQASGLVSTIDSLMQRAGIAYTDLAAIITTIGPGSFTGLRIGLAALHGFVLVNPTPIKTLTTLEAMAWHIARQLAAPGAFLVAIRAGKGELYVQSFTQAQGIPQATGEITLVPETKSNWPLPLFGNQLPAEDARFLSGPNTETLCGIAPHLATSSLAEALPLYIRPPDAIIPAAHAWLGT